jgi:hypothetical protein
MVVHPDLEGVSVEAASGRSGGYGFGAIGQDNVEGGLALGCSSEGLKVQEKERQRKKVGDKLCLEMRDGVLKNLQMCGMTIDFCIVRGFTRVRF